MAAAAARKDQPVLSDSDDDRPNQEPEFIVHVVDDDGHRRPPAPAPHCQMLRPPAPQLPVFHPPDPPPRHVYKKYCSTCFVVRVILFALVMALAVGAVIAGARVQKEYNHLPPLQWYPVVIGTVAIVWITCADIGDEDD